MEVCVSHWTAVRWLLRNPNVRDRPDATAASAASPSVPEVAPGFEETRELLDALASYLRVDDQGERVIDVLVSRPQRGHVSRLHERAAARLGAFHGPARV